MGTNAEPGAADVVLAAVFALRARDYESYQRAVDVLARRPRRQTATDVSRLIERHVGRAWLLGWQPADLARAVEKALGRREGELVRRAITSEAEAYGQLGRRVAPEWMVQVEQVRVAISPIATADPWLLLVSSDWLDALRASTRLIGLLMRLPAIPLLVEPPSEWHGGTFVRRASLPDGVLVRVRALLAKAESTTFAAESEAFTAKAQELMTRHRIDRALVDAGGTSADEPVGRRIAIDDPYADTKASLLAVVSDVNGCRAVWSKEFGFSTVFGFASELDSVEELFTSLLVQATSALNRAGSKRDAYGRSRTTRFRRSFLVAFGVRIGERLRETVGATIGAITVEMGTALVPVLAARSQATEQAAAQAFPRQRRFSPSVGDHEGWHAGKRCADHADLSVGRPLTRRSA
jgi:hypothetical protein